MVFVVNHLGQSQVFSVNHCAGAGALIGAGAGIAGLAGLSGAILLDVCGGCGAACSVLAIGALVAYRKQKKARGKEKLSKKEKVRCCVHTMGRSTEYMTCTDRSQPTIQEETFGRRASAL